MAAKRLVPRVFGITTLLSGAYISIEDNHSISRQTIVVTSTNPEKLRAVNKAFNEHYSDTNINFNVIGYKSYSGIYHGQPWGLQHTFEAAMTRIRSIKDILSKSNDTPDPSYIVSVENGVESLLQHHETIGIDTACVIIAVMSDHEQYIGISQGRPYPLQTIQSMKRQGATNQQIGDFCVEYYKSANLSITREDQIYQATLMALSQIKQS